MFKTKSETNYIKKRKIFLAYRNILSLVKKHSHYSKYKANKNRLKTKEKTHIEILLTPFFHLSDIFFDIDLASMFLTSLRLCAILKGHDFVSQFIL